MSIKANSVALLPHSELLDSLSRTPKLQLESNASRQSQLRLIKLDEIHEAHYQTYRKALANAYSSVQGGQAVRLIYLLEGTSNGIGLYLGVVADQGDTHEAIKNLRGALEGQLPGINFGNDMTLGERKTLENSIHTANHRGVILGTPTLTKSQGESEEENFQSIDRLVRTMQSSISPNEPKQRWQLTVLSQPLSDNIARHQLDLAYSLSSELALLAKTNIQSSRNTNTQESNSKGKNTTKGSSKRHTLTKVESDSRTKATSESGTETTNNDSKQKVKSSSIDNRQTSENNKSDTDADESSHSNTETSGNNWTNTDSETFSISREVSNKKAQYLSEYLEEVLIPRLQKGMAKGLFSSAVYITAENRSTYQRLSNAACATFKGADISFSPLKVYDLPKNESGSLFHLPRISLGTQLSSEEFIFNSLLNVTSPNTHLEVLGSLLTAEELATFAGLPQGELQGIRSKKTTRFAVDLPHSNNDQAFRLGHVIDQGRQSPFNPVKLNRQDLNKHLFVTGVTGAGKTTTCLNLLRESHLPFLVIEPAKTEYRELRRYESDVRYYRPNGGDHQSLRINPFAIIRKDKSIKSHASFLKNVFTTVFPMEASMPMMVEAAILAAYEDKGWDIDQDEFLPDGDPFEPITRAWPTMDEMVRQLDSVIVSYGLGKDFEEKYRGSLVSRFQSLTNGTLGQALNVPQSIDFISLLEHKVVLELEMLQSGEDKALLMALLLGCINDAIRVKHSEDADFRQVTLIEEAHRLLSRPEPGDKAAAMAVGAFADMLAEVRKFGVSMIIVDQIPAKLIPDVIKNTNTKIVHRLFAEDDRRAMGEAMMMDDKQRAFLPNLGIGEAIVFCGGWHGAAHTKIRDDLAQTDNLQEKDLDINALGLQQLWSERVRYYPNFCQLGWLTENAEDASRFAEFVRQTRQAQSQMFYFAANWNTDHEPNKRTVIAFERVKRWIMDWQLYAESDLAGSEANTEPKLLAKSWAALLHDGSPLLRPEIKEKITHLLDTSQSELAYEAEQLFRLLQCSETITDFKENKRSVHDRDVFAHLGHLKNYRNI